MGIGGHREDGVDGYVATQQAVEAAHKPPGVGRHGVAVEVRHHHGGVHPGVGATRAGYGYWCAQHRGHGAFYGFLHCCGIGLRLPAVKFRAAV